jgi:hypothetical protein
MKQLLAFSFSIVVALGLGSCQDPSKPNYQYFPNMYEPVGYEAYADSDAFANGIEAQIPAEGSIARGWQPYDYPDTNEGYEAAKAIEFSLDKQMHIKQLEKNCMVFTVLFVMEKRRWSRNFNDT